MPLVTKGDRGSPGMAFLFTVSPIAVEQALGVAAGNVGRREIHQTQVVIRAAGNQAQPSRDEPSPSAAQFSTTRDVGAELRAQRLAERDSLARDDVHERTALRSGNTACRWRARARRRS